VRLSYFLGSLPTRFELQCFATIGFDNLHEPLTTTGEVGGQEESSSASLAQERNKLPASDLAAFHAFPFTAHSHSQKSGFTLR
jgi:hypothetical protein